MLVAPVGSARINLAGEMSVTVMGVEEERGRSARPAVAAALVEGGAVVVGEEEDGAVVVLVELGVVVATGQDKVVVVAVATRNEEKDTKATI